MDQSVRGAEPDRWTGRRGAGADGGDVVGRCVQDAVSAAATVPVSAGVVLAVFLERQEERTQLWECVAGRRVPVGQKSR